MSGRFNPGGGHAIGAKVNPGADEWVPTISGNAELRLSMVPAGAGPALRMDYVFNDAGGFVVARRAFARSMPAEYALRFRLRGRGTVHALELKLIDDTNQNVWRHVIANLTPSARWKGVTVESRAIDFAWGPASGRGVSQLGFVEFAIVAVAAGAGTLSIADLAIEDRTPTQAPLATASSALPDFAAGDALQPTGWKPLAEDPRPWISLDLIQPRRLGGLTIEWLGAAPADGFRVLASSGGKRWKTVYTAKPAARMYTCRGSTRAACGWNFPSRSTAQPCSCSLSTFRGQSTISGTTSPRPNRAAFIRAGCTGSRPCGPRSARRTAPSARS